MAWEPSSDPSERGKDFAMNVLMPLFLGLTSVALVLACWRGQQQRRKASLQGVAVPLVNGE